MLPDKPLRELMLHDIQQLITDEIAENDRLEYKQALPSKDPAGDPWLQGNGEVGRYAKEKLLAELVALANSHGGYLLLGITETDNNPPRASSISPIPLCAELAPRLAQMADSNIDPKLPQLDVQPIKVAADGSGVIVFHTLRSAVGPHRLTTNKECYIRRNERCEAVSMREIQDMTLRVHRQAEEGLWTACFGYPTADRNGGVVILEAGRLFGGDSTHYYEGRYEIFDSDVRAEFRVVHYFGDSVSAFGDKAPRFSVILRGKREAEHITGTLFRHDMPSIRPIVVLQRRANLP